MVILTTTYNCEKYVERCLLSIMSQSHKDFVCYITDDMSTDNTVNIIKKTINHDSRFILIENNKKLYQPGNYDSIIRYSNIDNNEICVEVDGDDWLPSPQVFYKINEIYQDPNVWMTTGSFKYHDGRMGFAKPPNTDENIRTEVFTLSHIRTWRAWLWRKIDEKDLKDNNGNYWDVAGDLSFMFPMFEMSGLQHYRFISDILYVYNESNPINDHKINLNRVYEVSNTIRNKSPYNKI